MQEYKFDQIIVLTTGQGRRQIIPWTVACISEALRASYASKMLRGIFSLHLPVAHMAA